MKFYFSLEAPWFFVLTNAKGEVTDAGEAADLASCAPPDGVTEVIGIAPGEAVTTRSVEVPGRRRGHVEAAMPYALEDSLSEDVDALHFTLLGWEAGQPAEVAVVARDRLAAWIAAARDAGLRMDRVIPGYLLLPRYDGDSVTVAPAGNSTETLYVRTGDRMGLTIDREFLPWWIAEEAPGEGTISVTDLTLARELSADHGNRVRYWDIGATPGDWLRLSHGEVVPVNLLHGDFVPAHRSRNLLPLKAAAVAGLVAVALLYGSLLMESRRLQAEDQELNQEMNSVFRQHFPGEPWLGRPRFQVESLLQAREGGSDGFGFQSLLAAITGVTRQHRAEIEELNFRDDAMIVLCNVRSLSVLDEIQASLQSLPGLEAELLSSGARDDQVTGRFRVSRS